MSDVLRIAVIGGTGAEGRGLALRWAAAGHAVTIGSRSAEKAEAAASELNEKLGREALRGADNRTAADDAEIVVLAVPYPAQHETLRGIADLLAGKILIDVTVPLVPPKVSRVQLPPEGAATLASQALLGSDVRVVAAFQNVSAHHLQDLDYRIDCDVLVCGDDREAREVAVRLAGDAGLCGLHAGPLANAAAVEALTSVLIFMNRHYKVPSSGIRITGLPEPSA